MKFKYFEYLKDKTWIHILPTIVIRTDDPTYYCKNVALQIHILIWHFKWFWREVEPYENDN